MDNPLLLISRHLKRWGWRNITAACAAVVLGAAMLVATVAAEPAPTEPVSARELPKTTPIRPKPELSPPVPAATDVDRAIRWAKRRDGDVSFAVIGDGGGVAGYRTGATFPSASTVKVMLMVAELRRLDQNRLKLDRETKELLRQMIRVSDNDAADTIYNRVSDGGLHQVATDARMDKYEVQGAWGNSRLSALDLARLMRRVRALTPSRFREFAMDQMAGVVPDQSWGAPAVARPDWQVWLKGGWLPESSVGVVVHQAALLKSEEHRMSVAVLTANNPSHAYGVETVEGIVKRLIGR